MKNILIPVHSNFEETELITTLNVLNRNKINYYLWSIEGLETVRSSHEAFVDTKPDFPVHTNFDGIFFHGGPAVKDLVDYDEILHLATSYFDDNKIVAAICAAPQILHKAGILTNKTFTAFPDTKLEGNTEKEVEIDGNIVTGRDYTITQKFAEALVEQIKNS